MDLRELEVFQVVADLGSLTRAADRLHMAQPVLSRHIKALETEVRVDLFTRTGRGMELTEAGRELLRRSGGLVDEVRRLRDDIRSFEGVPRGAVVIGLVPTVSELISGRFAERVIDELPEVALRVVEGYTGHLIDWMHRGELDLAVGYGSTENAHVHVERLGVQPLVAVGAEKFGLAASRPIEFEMLAGLPLALPGPAHGLRALIDRAAIQSDVSLNIVVEADSFRVLLDIVSRGVACTLLPRSAADAAERRIVSSPVVNPSVARELVVASPIGRTPTIAMGAVLEIVREEATGLLLETSS